MKVLYSRKSKKMLYNVIPFLLLSLFLSRGINKKYSPTNSFGVTRSFISEVGLCMVDNKPDVQFSYANGQEFLGEFLLDNNYLIKSDVTNGYIYCDGIREFKKYLEVKNPTYADVQSLIYKKNINKVYKKWLLQGLDNLEKSLPNLDLSVLYYNIERMEITEISIEEMKERVGLVVACFSIKDGVVYVIPDNVSFDVLCHEVFGHGISLAETFDDGMKIRANGNLCLLENNFSDNYSISMIGKSLEEAKATMIASIAAGNEVYSSYEIETEQMRMFFESCGVKVEDYIEYGPSYLVRKMLLNDINEPLNYLASMDGLFSYSLATLKDSSLPIEDSFRMPYNLKAYFKDYVDDKLKRGVPLETIEKQIEEIFDNSDFYQVESFGLSSLEPVIIDDLKVEVISSIKDLDKSKVYKISKVVSY